MRINFRGQLTDEPEIRAGFIGCGSHSFRNIYPTFQFAPVKLVATCDVVVEKARAFADKFGAKNAYDDYHTMLEQEELDAVFIVTGYDGSGRPQFPRIAEDCLKAGCHVWFEKPPAATCAAIEGVQRAAQAAGRNVLVGLKKMFFPANEKARELAYADEFGRISLATFQYPAHLPTQDEIRRYLNDGENVESAVAFLDHLCHPASLMLFMLGMPETLYYERSASSGGVATFTFTSGAVASITMTKGASLSGGLERTTIVSDSGKHIVVENNTRLCYHRNPDLPYGASPSYFTGDPAAAAAVWEPEFSLGQLYNKGLFLLGYYNEVNEFARSIIEHRPPAKGTLEHAWQVTRIFEAFAEGPGRVISLA